MKLFIYFICLSGILQYLAAHLYTRFSGSSKGFYNYLGWVSGIGGFVVYAVFIAACFITTWWIPIIAFFVKVLIQSLIPPIPAFGVLAAYLFPVSFLLSIILMILGV